MQEQAIGQISDFVENTSYLTWDTLIVFGVLFFIIVYAYTFGKDHIIPLLVSIYAAGFVMLFVPYVENVRALIESDLPISNTIVFFVILIALFFIIKSNGFFEPYIVPTGYELGTFCIGIVGLLCVIVGSFMSLQVIASFSPAIRLLFFGDIATTAWALAPIGLLLIIRGDT